MNVGQLHTPLTHGLPKQLLQRSPRVPHSKVLVPETQRWLSLTHPSHSQTPDAQVKSLLHASPSPTQAPVVMSQQPLGHDPNEQVQVPLSQV